MKEYVDFNVIFEAIGENFESFWGPGPHHDRNVLGPRPTL